MKGTVSLANAAWFLVGADLGCDAQLKSEPADDEFRRRLIAERRRGWRAIADAKAAWGIR